VQDDSGRHDPLNWGNDNNRLIARILKFNDFKAKYITYLKQMVDAGEVVREKAGKVTLFKVTE
jgi:hypothetical protein